MVLERFIADKLYRQREKRQGGTRPAALIATIGVSLGMFVMILTIAVTQGFRTQITRKVTGFTRDIVVCSYFQTEGTDSQPVVCLPETLDRLASKEYISHAQRYVEKSGILRTDSSFQGFVLKGVGPEYDTSYMIGQMVEGSFPVLSDTASSGGILLSVTLADLLDLKVGDKVDACFMDERIRVRRLEVTGLYQTNFSDYDKIYAVTDIYTLQRLNGWNSSQVTGVEVDAVDEATIYESYLDCRDVFENIYEQTGESFLIRTTRQINAGLFAWLDVLNINVVIILLLMLGIAGFTIISGLLIMIFERTGTIGLLKALGASDTGIRKIFLLIASKVVLKGMLIGNAAGIGFCIAQQKLHMIPLDPETYYLDSVPCQLGIVWLVLLNIFTFAASVLMLAGPSAVISRISPAKSIRFE